MDLGYRNVQTLSIEWCTDYIIQIKSLSSALGGVRTHDPLQTGGSSTVDLIVIVCKIASIIYYVIMKPKTLELPWKYFYKNNMLLIVLWWCFLLKQHFFSTSHAFAMPSHTVTDVYAKEKVFGITHGTNPGHNNYCCNWAFTEGLTTEFQVFAHSCVIIIEKLHEIPYHTVNTWNEVVNPFLPLSFVSLYKIDLDLMFSVQVFCVLFQPWQARARHIELKG